MARKHLAVARVSKKTGLKFGMIPRGTSSSDLLKVAVSKVRALGAGKSELYVSKGTKRISRATVFISARQFKQAKQSAEHGFTKTQSLEKLAKGRTQNLIDYLTEASRDIAGKTRETARLRRAYNGEHVAAIRRFKELKKRKEAGEILNDEDFNFTMDFATQHTNQEHEFLHADFVSSPPVKSKGSRGSKQLREPANETGRNDSLSRSHRRAA
jgi:hypothetical protein